MEQQRTHMLKVLCPVESKNGKTYWIRIGNAFINRDGSTNVYLNAYPTSGKLQIREFDEHSRDDDDLGPPGRIAPARAPGTGQAGGLQL